MRNVHVVPTVFVAALVSLFATPAVAQTACPELIALGDIGHGVAARDNATGDGYLMWSSTNVHTRFSPGPHPGAADHLIAVLWTGSEWRYDNNGATYAFTPDADDCLLATLDYSQDSATPLLNQEGPIHGIDGGFSAGTLVVTPNRWAGSTNPGEFTPTGTSLNHGGGGSQPDTICPNTMELGDIGYGVAARDHGTESGYIMRSTADVHQRFSPSPLGIAADHYVVVVWDGTNWLYDNNNVLTPFLPASDDCLIASVDLAQDTASVLDPSHGTVHGIDSGWTGDDIVVDPNVWNLTSNPGEFGMRDAPPPAGSWSPTNCPATFDLGPINHGIAARDNATGQGYIMWSHDSVHSRFYPAPHPANADHLIAVVWNGANWTYDNNSALTSFVPEPDDCIIAEVDFSADTVTTLQGDLGRIEDIDGGYHYDDLTIDANVWGGSANPGEFRPTADVTLVHAELPTAVAPPTVTPNYNLLDITWSEPYALDPILEYRVAHTSDPLGGVGTITSGITGLGHTLTFSNAMSGIPYAVRVAARTEAGWGAWSAPSTAAPWVRTPPTGLTATATAGNRTLTVSWNSQWNGADVTSAVVEYGVNGFDNAFPCATCGESGSLTIPAMHNRNYLARVRLYTSVGDVVSGTTGDHVWTPRLYEGEQLVASERLRSPNGEYIAVMQYDGNFVVYGGPNYSVPKQYPSSGFEGSTATSVPWSTARFLIGGEFQIVTPGNAVLYTSGVRDAVCTTGVNDLVLQNDGNMVIYNEFYGAIWSFETLGICPL